MFFDQSYSVINNSEEINLLDYCYYYVLIPDGVQLTIDGVTMGPFDAPIIVPITSVCNVVTTGGLVFFIGDKKNPNIPITGDNYIISDVSQGEEIVISEAGDDIIWS